MKNNTRLLSLILIFMSQFTYAQDAISINTKNFTKLNISTGFNVKIIQGEECNLKVSIDPEYEKYLRVNVTASGELRLSVRIPWFVKNELHSDNKAIYSAAITAPKLEAIKLSDAVHLESEGTFMVDRFVGHFSDASIVNNVSLKGRDENSDVELVVSDASLIDMNINNYQCVLKLKDAASAIINGDFSYMTTEVSDATNMQIKGKTIFARYISSGSSNIEAADFIAKDVSIDTKQASYINCYVTERISELRQSGAPKITINSQGVIKMGFRE